MAGEDPRVAVNKVTTKPVPAKRRTKQKKYKQPPETNDQQDKCGKCGYRPNKPQEKCPAKNEPWNKCNKLGHFAQLSTSQKNRVNSLNEEVYPNNAYSSDNEEYVNVHLLCKASLEMNGVCNKSHCCDEDEWWETLEVGSSTLRCQLETSAHVNVINIS